MPQYNTKETIHFITRYVIKEKTHLTPEVYQELDNRLVEIINKQGFWESEGHKGTNSIKITFILYICIFSHYTIIKFC